MNFNSLILDNVLASPYYKNQLSLIKTYHEVIDEIYYNVSEREANFEQLATELFTTEENLSFRLDTWSRGREERGEETVEEICPFPPFCTDADCFRRTTGQTGMCGGVRGVGAGGVVSTPYCLLYKLFTLRPTRKQLYGLLNHTDSPYIRAVGFMFIR